MEHLKFNRVRIKEKDRRKKRGFGLPVKQKKFEVQGDFIEKAIDKSVNDIKNKSSQFNFNPYLVLKVELEDDVQFTEDEESKLELFGLKIIDKENNRLQVVFSQDLRLKIFKDELRSYKEGKIAKTKVKNEDLFCKIKQISEWDRNDRLQFKLEDVKENDYVDVYLWVFDTVELSKEKMKEFKKFILSYECRICDDYVGSSVVVARIKVKGDIIDKILENPLVYKVETINKIKIVLNKIRDIKETTIDDLEFDNTSLNPDTSSSICVIDSGIYAQHPLFKGVIGDAKTFYINNSGISDNSDDISGHGTEVASICEYGDFTYNKKFEPKIYLHNAKIHNGQYDDVITLWQTEVKSQIGEFTDTTYNILSKYEEGVVTFEEVINSFEKDQQPYIRMVYSKYSNMYEKLIPTQMRQIVEYFYNNYGCRIYNLSQGDSSNIYYGNKPKAWACVLDELQEEYNVLFIVSAGNYYYGKNNNYSNIVNEYPKYFYNKTECKIIEPANSALSITVGSMAISDNIYNTLTRINKRAITKKSQLSTITRVGPGIQNSIKPEFIAYGGDCGIESNLIGEKTITENIGLSKLVFNNQLNGLFTWDKGTSFAAPYISHLAATILNRYPDISNNLIRAIISNSSKIPNMIMNDNKTIEKSITNALDEFKYRGNNNLIKMIYYTSGYGFPDKEQCLNSIDNRVVLMADIDDSDALEVDKMHVFEIPLPDEFRKVKGRKRVIVSLAFTPKVRNTRIDYLGVSMEFKLIKGKSINEVIEIYESQTGKDKITPKEDKYECDLKPGNSLRNKGTLQKGVFEFSLDKNFNNQNLYLLVNCIKGWDNTPQKYAVAVTLESDNKAQFYNIIKNKIQQQIHQQIRI